MAKGRTCKDPNASTKYYKVEVHWWRQSCSSKDMKELYKNCLHKNQYWVMYLEPNMFIDVDSIIWAWSPKEGWLGNKIRINEKGFIVVKAQ